METSEAPHALTATPHDVLYSETLEQHGSRWQIQVDAETGRWIAIERPTASSLNFMSARTLEGLRAKLDDDAKTGL